MNEADSNLLQQIPIMPPDHYPANYDPGDLAKIEFLQTCVRLNIPDHRIPPLRPSILEPCLGVLAPFQPPRIDLFRIREWPKKADAAWREYRDQIIRRFTEIIQSTLTSNPPVRTRKSGPKRDIPPRSLAFEWAVRNYCLEESWTAIHADEERRGGRYSLDQVNKHGYRILREVGLRK
jgi:hypothetical protein